MEFNSAKNSEVSFTGPDVKEADNLSKKIKTFTDDLLKRYKDSRVELEECRNRIEQLKLNHDAEKAGKERALKVLAAYVKQTRDERQQYTQQINSLENFVLMLMMKTKNSAGQVSRLEEKKDTSSNNKPTTSGKSDVESRSITSEEVDINAPSENLASSIMGPHQPWIDTDLSLEDASIIEEVDEIPRDREKDREIRTLTASRLEKRLQELKSENEQLRSHCDLMMRILIEGERNTGKTNKVNKEAETRVKPTKTTEIVEKKSEKENKVLKSDSTVPTKEKPVSPDTSITLSASSTVATDSSELSKPLEKEKTEIKDVSDKTDKPVDKNVAKAYEPLFSKFKPPPGSWMCQECFVQNKPDDLKCIACENYKNYELILASKASPALLNQQSKAHLSSLISLLPSSSEISTTITLTSRVSSTSTTSTPITASSSFAFGKSTASDKNLKMSTGSLGEPSQTKISSSGFSSDLAKPVIYASASVSTVTTAPTAPTFTFGSTSSAGTTSKSGFTFGQAPKTTQSSRFSRRGLRSKSSNAPPGTQSNIFDQGSTSSFEPTPSTSQAKRKSSIELVYTSVRDANTGQLYIKILDIRPCYK